MPDPKIKAKDLTYEASLPPFLQRLHAQKAGRGGDPDRHEHAVARPKRVKNADEDDGPTVVDESGESVSMEEWEKLNSGANGDSDVKDKVDGDIDQVGRVADADTKDDEVRKGGEQKITDGTVMATKKRKVGKVVGEDDVDVEEKVFDERLSKPVKKTKKKAKPIKLAFDDEEGE